jgi:hypothetical protein
MDFFAKIRYGEFDVDSGYFQKVANNGHSKCKRPKTSLHKSNSIIPHLSMALTCVQLINFK